MQTDGAQASKSKSRIAGEPPPATDQMNCLGQRLKQAHLSEAQRSVVNAVVSERAVPNNHLLSTAQDDVWELLDAPWRQAVTHRARLQPGLRLKRRCQVPQVLVTPGLVECAADPW